MSKKALYAKPLDPSPPMEFEVDEEGAGGGDDDKADFFNCRKLLRNGHGGKSFPPWK